MKLNDQRRQTNAEEYADERELKQDGKRQTKQRDLRLAEARRLKTTARAA